MSNQDLIQYDDEKAVNFIQSYLPQELKGKFSTDQINYVIDIIYDFYESEGYMKDDADEETMVDINEDDIINYVSKGVQKDSLFNFTDEEISHIIQGELAYCDSIGLFE